MTSTTPAGTILLLETPLISSISISIPDAAGDVSVVAASLSLPGSRLRGLARTLSPGERERARRLANPLLRRRFVAARSLLRELLGPVLGVLPGEIEIGAEAGGKPRVDGGPFFNLAHSGELAVFALGPAEVGVDVERVRPVPDRDRLAAEVFTPGERSAFAAIAPERRDEAFAAGWTRKESYLKARADGLGMPLRRAVTVRPDEPAKLLWVADEPREPGRWSLAAFVPAEGYVGALAVELAV